MLWIFFAFLAPMLHGGANILDSYLTNALFKRTTTLLFFATLMNVVFLPFVLLFELPAMPMAEQLPFFLLLGIIGVTYLFPYYKALQQDDTSVVVALFSLGKIFVPLLAFLIVGETLSLTQYIGFGIIIISGSLLTFNGNKSIRFNGSLFWMLLCSFILALEIVIYKFLFTQVSWSTGFVWSTLFSFFLVLPFLFHKKTRDDIRQNIVAARQRFSFFAAEEFLTFSGSAAATFAISLAPVTIVDAIASFQSVIVLVYALIFGRKFCHLFREDVTAKVIIKKVMLFLLMIGGVILILRF